MTRVLIADFGIIQKTFANAVVAFYLTDANGVNTGVLAVIYQDDSSGLTQSNPQTLDENGMLAQDCYVSGQIMGAISGLSPLEARSIKKVRANPLEFSLPVTSANWAMQAGEDLYGNLAAVQAAVAAVQAVLTNAAFEAVSTDLLGADTIGTTASIAGSVVIVAGNTTNINAVASNIAGANTIGTVASAVANVNNVGNNIAHVVAVDGNASNINAAVANATNINTVAGDAAAINTVAGDHTPLNIVATAIASVITAATNIANINIVAAAIASVNICASNIASIILAAAGVVSYKKKTASYQILTTDTAVELTSGSGTFTFPDFTACAAGKEFCLINSGSGVLTWATTSAQTVNGQTGGTVGQYNALTIYGNAVNAVIKS